MEVGASSVSSMFPGLVVVAILSPLEVGAQIESGTNASLFRVPDNAEIDIFCAGKDVDASPLLRGIGNVFSVTRWCGAWPLYTEHRQDVSAVNGHRVAIISKSDWSEKMVRFFISKMRAFFFICWLAESQEGALSSSECWCSRPLPGDILVHQDVIAVLFGSLFNCSTCEKVGRCTPPGVLGVRNGIGRRRTTEEINSPLKEYSSIPTLDVVAATTALRHRAYRNASWSALSSHRLALGCMSLWCKDEQRNGVLDVLSVLGVNYTVSVVTHDNWAESLAERKIDIVVENMAFTEDRWRKAYFPLPLSYGTTLFYVPRRFSVQADKILRALPVTFFALVYVSLAACVACFCLINYLSGRAFFKDIQEVVLALIATTMLFTYPIPKTFRRNVGGCVVLSCWMAAGFSLAVYFQSLLTSSLSSRNTWEADDSLEKLYPKLASGKLLPCVQQHTYFELLLQRSAGSQGIIGAMASAGRRWSDENSTLGRTSKVCVDRVLRGTHVFLSTDIERCDHLIYSKLAVPGKESIQTLYGGTPTRSDFPLRHGYNRLVSKMVETGLPFQDERTFQWNCSRLEAEAPFIGFDMTQIVHLYYGCCAAATAVLILEVAVHFTSRRLVRRRDIRRWGKRELRLYDDAAFHLALPRGRSLPAAQRARASRRRRCH